MRNALCERNSRDSFRRVSTARNSLDMPSQTHTRNNPTISRVPIGRFSIGFPWKCFSSPLPHFPHILGQRPTLFQFHNIIGHMLADCIHSLDDTVAPIDADFRSWFRSWWRCSFLEEIACAPTLLIRHRFPFRPKCQSIRSSCTAICYPSSLERAVSLICVQRHRIRFAPMHSQMWRCDCDWMWCDRRLSIDQHLWCHSQC